MSFKITKPSSIPMVPTIPNIAALATAILANKIMTTVKDCVRFVPPEIKIPPAPTIPNKF